jgi:hypothetical protein
MKRIFCVIAAVLVLLPPVLAAREFNPAKGPLEGVWENEEDEEEVLIFTGNLVLEKSWRDSGYEVYPGMVYTNGEAYSEADPESGPEYMFGYKVSGNTLELTDEYDDVTKYKRSGDAILQNKSRLEGIWEGSLQNPDNPDLIVEFAYIFLGELMIASMKLESYTEYMAAGFSYSDLDNTLSSMDDTISCTVSGDAMTLTDGSVTVVLARKR